MATAKAVSSYLIEIASELDENDLTNLKIQKLLYYAQVESFKRENEPIFDDVIEAWKYGPVVPDVYYWLQECGAYSIDAFDIPTDSSGLTAPERALIDDVWAKYGKYSASYLVMKTHEPGEPWAAVFDERRHHVVIPVQSLIAATTADAW